MVVKRCNSDWLPVVSGVPQGSVLGPLLFLLYINDMPSTIQNSTVALFADDSIKNISDCKLLQKDIDSLYSWSVMWDLHFNTSKCQIISISRCKQLVNFDYKLNNISLERTDSVRDLGVDISSGIIWNNHVNRIVGKCNKMMGLIIIWSVSFWIINNCIQSLSSFLRLTHQGYHVIWCRVLWLDIGLYRSTI